MLSIRPVTSEAWSQPSCDLLFDFLLDRLDSLSFLFEPLLPLRREELRPLVLLFFREPSRLDPEPPLETDFGLRLLLLPVLLPLVLLLPVLLGVDDLELAGLSDFLSRSVLLFSRRTLSELAPMAFWPGLTDRARRLPNLPRDRARAGAGDLERDLDRFFFGFSGGRTRSREMARPVEPCRGRNMTRR